MLAVCRYYTSNVRLVSGISVFMDKPGFRMFNISGTVLNNKGVLRVLTPVATIMVSCISPDTKRNLLAILTTDQRYREFDGKRIDTDIIVSDDINLSLCTLLKEKFSRTKNPFEIEFSGDGRSMTVTADEIEGSVQLRTTIHSVSGDLIIVGEHSLSTALCDCYTLRSFSYSSISPEFEKEVKVRKSRGEILREVSRYLSKTIVMAGFIPGGVVIEQYISSTAVLEVLTREDYSKVYKRISPVTLRNVAPFCLYLISASVDEIAREQGRCLKKS